MGMSSLRGANNSVCRWVWELNKQGKEFQRGLDILELRKNGYELAGGEAKKKSSAPGQHVQTPTHLKFSVESEAGKGTASKNTTVRTRGKKNTKKSKQQGASSRGVKQSAQPREKAQQALPNGKDVNQKRKREVTADTDSESDSDPDKGSKDSEDSEPILPARKRKKSAKVAENEARAAEKEKSELKPPRITKKAREEARKKVARQMQEVHVAEALTDMKR